MAAVGEGERPAADWDAAGQRIGPGIPGAGSPSAPSASSGSSSSSGIDHGQPPSAAAGKAVFTGAAGCGGCHMLAAAGTTGTIGPNLGTSIVPDAKKAGMALKPFIRESIVDPTPSSRRVSSRT